MKRQYFNRLLITALAIAGAAFNASCSTADNSEAWAKIQNEGLIPYLIDPPAKTQPIESEPQGQIASRSTLQNEEKPEISLLSRPQSVIAEVVPGKRGFVYSPHTSEKKMIDVRDFEVGSRVRCPYTKKAFVVPPLAPEVVSPQPRRTAPSKPVARRKPAPTRTAPKRTTSPKPRSKPVVAKKKVEQPKKKPVNIVKTQPEPKPKQTPITGIPKTNGSVPSESEALALPKKVEPSLPVATRVAGKPNYVHSPYAASNQVVDVEGYAAGSKVRCPYSDKIFTVPPASGNTAE